jgi:hypothetical protein
MSSFLTVALVLGTEGGVMVERHFGLASIWVALPVPDDRAAVLARHAAPGTGALAARRRAEIHSRAARQPGFVMGGAALLGLVNEGDPAPLPCVPHSIIELAQLGYLLLLLLCSARAKAKAARC